MLGDPLYTNITAYDAICDPRLLGNYLVPPEDTEDPEGLIEDISMGLCNMTTKQALDLTVLLVDQVNIEEFLSGVSVVTRECKVNLSSNLSIPNTT